MLGKILLKIVFKASLPIVAVAGVLSYGLYLKGGDPLSMWSTVADRTLGSIRETGSNTLQSVQALAPSGSSSTSQTTVYTWVDSAGITHYGSMPPAGVPAKAMHITTSEPSANRTPPTSIPTAAAAQPEQAERMPGMAGVKLPVNIRPDDLGLTQEELLKMIGQ